ncbi:MAG: hypothetical protein RL385_714 [Pseudomonadota bacterium]|jgi:NADPH:quinone reductase-like Zn-dependent oxidoreductase
MKAAVVTRYGPPEVVELRELPMPEPGPSEVRIKVLSTTVTAGDYRLRSGNMPRGFGPLRGIALGFGAPRKAVLGTEAAGIVDALGAGVTRFAVGDPVVAFPGEDLGGHAAYLLMPADGRVVHKPARLSFEEAAALPFGATTALDFLNRAALRAGERFLVHGASGNVGSMAVQLGKLRGAHVTAVCSGRNADLVRRLGADDVIDYTRTDFAGGGARYDVVMDAVGDAPYARVKSILNPGGRLIALVADLPAMLTAPFVGKGRKHRVLAGPAAERREDVETIVSLALEGALRAVIDQRFPFAHIVEAHRYVATGRKRGSVVVTCDG